MQENRTVSFNFETINNSISPHYITIKYYVRGWDAAFRFNPIIGLGIDFCSYVVRQENMLRKAIYLFSYTCIIVVCSLDGLGVTRT